MGLYVTLVVKSLVSKFVSNSLFSQGGPFSNEVDIQRGPGLEKNTKYHDNLKLKIKIKKHMAQI